MHLGYISLLITSLLICGTQCQDVPKPSEVVNKKVDRLIDISSQVVSITSKITFENVGKETIKSYMVTFDPAHEKSLAYISAKITGNDRSKSNLQVSKQDDGYQIDLGDSGKVISGSTSGLLEVEAIFTHLLDPYPTYINQADRQMVVYTESHYFRSPYLTKTQSTKIKLPPGSLESYTKLKPSSTADRAINLGPYENVQANSVSKLQVHFENNSPFLVATRLERTVHVSHWAAMVSIEELIDLRHDGAILKGSFSRYEFQREPSNGISSIKSFRTRLPSTAQDIYYRDEIGNISTSNVRQQMNSVLVELRPRFPLFGGWKTHYILGYNVPALDFLFSKGNNFILKIPFLEQMFDNMVVDEAQMSVILPEGASDIRLRLPYPILREKDGVEKTYLDTIGRPVIVLKKSNLVGAHIQDLEVHYKYNKLFMLAEPLLIVVALFILCLIVIVYVRLDFSLTKNPVKESAHKVSGLVERILKQQDKRAAIYDDYDRCGAKYKSSKDYAQYQNNLKRINQDYRNCTGLINEMLVRLKSEGASTDVIDKVSSLQKLDKSLKEQIMQQNVLLEKLVAGKTNKQMYLDADGNIGRKKEDLVDKIEAIVNSL